MRIAISTDGSDVSAHFGRCPHFTIIDMENGKVLTREILENPGHAPGYIPEFLREKGVECVVAGGMGRRAEQLFDQAGIKIIVGVQGGIDEVIDKLLRGELKGGRSLCEPGKGKGYGNEKTERTHEDPEG
ncbi:MAG: dinitrogenase iron-molybdenum cofactor [Spirochaetes bacterium DG_61]|nr:MAG: dinitrogenase iron-molybdenum cofactor [Spirochaetes bacterium DG_61]